MIRIELQYKIVYKINRLIYYMGLNPLAINEWLIDPEDTASILITKENEWILDEVKEYLDYETK